MEITYVTIDVSLGGGIERVIANQSNYLISKGYKIRIISLFQTNKNLKYPLNPEVKITFLSVTKFNSNYKIHLAYLFPRLYANLKMNHIIISMYPVISIFLATTKFNSKLIASEHSEFFSQGKLLRYLRNLTYRQIKRVVTLTDSGKRNFNKKNIQAQRIPNCTNFKSAIKTTLSKPVEIVFIGRFEAVKNPKLFIQIARWFENESLLNIQFKMYGEGNLRESLIEETSDLTNIQIFPFSDNIEKILENSNGLILTSITEAFPMVAIEAISKQVVIYGLDTQIGTIEILGAKSPRISSPERIKDLCFQIEKDFKTMDNYKKAIEETLINSSNYEESNVMNSWEQLFKELS